LTEFNTPRIPAVPVVGKQCCNPLEILIY